jgi:hypothetical protein
MVSALRVDAPNAVAPQWSFLVANYLGFADTVTTYGNSFVDTHHCLIIHH